MKALNRHARLCAISVALMCPVAHSFSETIVVRRSLPPQTTVAQGYQCALQAWKQNLGLWFVPPPFILDQGHPETGVGFVLMRVPPLGLREGIVCRDEPAADNLRMTYRVLNPSPFTWPVSEHVGEILFRPVKDDACELEWTVRWTPLAAWLPFFPQALKAITEFIIEWAATYIVELCVSSNYHDGQESGRISQLQTAGKRN